MISTFKSNPHFLKLGINTAIEDVKTFLKFLAESGCQGFECSEKSLYTIEAWGRKTETFNETLEDIRIDLGDCRRCRLSKERKNMWAPCQLHIARYCGI